MQMTRQMPTPDDLHRIKLTVVSISYIKQLLRMYTYTCMMMQKHLN